MMLEIRRLDPVLDELLLDEAHGWDRDAPRWRKDCEVVFGGEKWTTNDRRIHVGIFSDELCAVVHMDLVAKRTYEAHIAVKRSTDVDQLVDPISSIIEQMYGYGMLTGFVWLPAFNTAILRLCRAVGFEHDGVVMFKGTTHNRPIEWWRLSLV